MRRFRIGVVCVLGWICFGAGSASAQPVFAEVGEAQQRNMSVAESGALARIRNDAATRSVTVVRVDRNVLRNQPDALVSLNLRANLNLNARALSVEPMEGERFVWTGEIAANQGFGSALPAGNATIVINGANATGTIQTPDGKLFKLQPIGGGSNALIEVDRSALPPDHEPGPAPAARPRSQNDRAGPASRDAAVEGPPVIDLVVAYTTNAKVAAGDIDSLIDLAIAETNQSFVKSGVAASMRLVHKVEYDYSDATLPDETCRRSRLEMRLQKDGGRFWRIGRRADGLHTRSPRSVRRRCRGPDR